MGAEEYPTFNGFAQSWADISTTMQVIGGSTFKDIDYKSIKAKSAVTRGDQMGASGGRVMARTRGSVKHEGSVEFYVSGLTKFLEQAIIPAAPSRGDVKMVSLVTFNIVILHTLVGSSTIRQDEMMGCSLSGFDWSMLEGDDAEIVAVDLAPLEVYRVIDGQKVALL